MFIFVKFQMDLILRKKEVIKNVKDFHHVSLKFQSLPKVLHFHNSFLGFDKEDILGRQKHGKILSFSLVFQMHFPSSMVDYWNCPNLKNNFTSYRQGVWEYYGKSSYLIFQTSKSWLCSVNVNFLPLQWGHWLLMYLLD